MSPETLLEEGDPHEWLAQRSCSFSQWPPRDTGSFRSLLTSAQFQDGGMAERPLLLRMPVDVGEAAANWSIALDTIAREGRVRSLRAAHHRSEGGLYRYLKKFEVESSLSDFLERVATAQRRARIKHHSTANMSSCRRTSPAMGWARCSQWCPHRPSCLSQPTNRTCAPSTAHSCLTSCLSMQPVGGWKMSPDNVRWHMSRY